MYAAEARVDPTKSSMGFISDPVQITINYCIF